MNCVTLSDTGNLFAVGLADSSVKVFWLNRSSLVRSLGMGDNNPFVEKDPSQILAQPYTLTSDTSLRLQLYAEQYETAMTAGAGTNTTQKRATAAKQMLTAKSSQSPIVQALRNSERLALDLRPDFEESKILKE